MIGAASECLHQYTIDVVFVIYPSNRSYENDDECYQVNILQRKKVILFIYFLKGF
jgi:hypothetical protein